jgi:Domain of unknown function (DUF6916)
MANPRREFIKKGAIAALALSVPAGAAKSSFAASLMAPLGGHSPLSMANFEPHLNSRFTIHAAGSKVAEVTLIQVRNLTKPAKLKRQPQTKDCFSLLFDDPGLARLPQDTYVLSHASLGKLTFFIVPVLTKRSNRSRYEVIVNRLA